jgi:hypothetical protein
MPGSTNLMMRKISFYINNIFAIKFLEKKQAAAKELGISKRTLSID